MTAIKDILLANAIAFISTLAGVAATSAHAGEQHAAEGPAGSGAIGLAAVVIAVIGGWWLANRGSHSTANSGGSDEAASDEAPRSSNLSADPRATLRAHANTSLIATRRLAK